MAEPGPTFTFVSLAGSLRQSAPGWAQLHMCLRLYPYCLISPWKSARFMNLAHRRSYLKSDWLKPNYDRYGHQPEINKAPLPRGFKFLSGQRAYLAGPCGPTTSAAEELNCRVRDGNGCYLLAMATRIETFGAPRALRELHSRLTEIACTEPSIRALV